MNKRTARIRRGLKTKAIQKTLSRPGKPGRPRLVVYRSATHIYCQIVEPTSKGDNVLVSSSSVDNELKNSLSGSKVDRAKQVGKLLGDRAKAKQIINVSFDRAGYRYHGRVKALADAAREAGLNF